MGRVYLVLAGAGGGYTWSWLELGEGEGDVLQELGDRTACINSYCR